MIALKEFPASYRTAMACLGDAGFTRIPSMPMTKLALPFKHFDEHMRTKLSAGTRMKLRACASAHPPVTLEVTQDASGMVDDIYPLYLNVFAQSPRLRGGPGVIQRCAGGGHSSSTRVRWRMVNLIRGRCLMAYSNIERLPRLLPA